MPRVIGAGERIRVEMCRYQKKGRRYDPVKDTAFFIYVPNIAALRRAHAEIVRVLEKGEWRDDPGGDSVPDDRGGDLAAP